MSKNVEIVVSAMMLKIQIELPTYGTIVGPKVVRGIPTSLNHGWGNTWFVQLSGDFRGPTQCVFDNQTVIRN